jgi:hypothetical protein
MGIFDTIFGGGTDTSTLRGGTGKANRQLSQIYPKGKNITENYSDRGIDDITAGLSAANPIYRDAANNYNPYMYGGAQSQLYENAANNYNPYIQSGKELNQFYNDQLTGGPDHFVETDGYKAVRDAGEQSIMRNNAAMGGTASGINAADLDKYNVGLQEQYRQQYLDNLFQGGAQGLDATNQQFNSLLAGGQQGLNAAQGQANVLTQLGGITNQAGRDRADIQMDTGRQLTDLLSGVKSAQATNSYNGGLNLQNQAYADTGTEAGLLQSILGIGSAYAGRKTV